MIHFFLFSIMIIIGIIRYLNTEDKNTVNEKEIEGSLEYYYLTLLGLENHYNISAETINDAFLTKIELLGNLEGETDYINDLKAGRAYLLDACKLQGAWN